MTMDDISRPFFRPRVQLRLDVLQAIDTPDPVGFSPPLNDLLQRADHIRAAGNASSTAPQDLGDDNHLTHSNAEVIGHRATQRGYSR